MSKKSGSSRSKRNHSAASREGMVLCDAVLLVGSDHRTFPDSYRMCVKVSLGILAPAESSVIIKDSQWAWEGDL